MPLDVKVEPQKQNDDMMAEDKGSMFKNEDVKKDDSNEENKVENNVENLAKPDEIPVEVKEPVSEYEDATDPEYDAFNSDDSDESKRIICVNFR